MNDPQEDLKKFYGPIKSGIFMLMTIMLMSCATPQILRQPKGQTNEMPNLCISTSGQWTGC